MKTLPIAFGMLIVLSINISQAMDNPKVQSEQQRRLEVLEKLLGTCKNKDMIDRLVAQGAAHRAAAAGRLDVLKLLEECGADLSFAEEGTGFLPIHAALLVGAPLEIIAFLLPKLEDMNYRSLFGSTLMHYAVDEGRDDVIRLLVANGMSVNSRVTMGKRLSYLSGYESLHIAARAERPSSAVIGTLLEYGGHINHRLDISAMSAEWNEQSIGALHVAMLHGNVEGMIELIAHGVEITIPVTQESVVPLDPTQVGVLTERMERMNENQERYSPLLQQMYSLLSRNTLDVEQLPEEVTISSMLRMAAGQGNSELCLSILQDYSDRLTFENATEALIGAAAAGHREVVSLLWEHLLRMESQTREPARKTRGRRRKNQRKRQEKNAAVMHSRRMQAGERALAMAAGQRRLNVFNYLVLCNVPLRRAGNVLHALRNSPQEDMFSRLIYHLMYNALVGLLRGRKLLKDRSLLPRVEMQAVENYREVARVSPIITHVGVFGFSRQCAEVERDVNQSQTTWLGDLPPYIIQYILQLLFMSCLHDIGRPMKS